MARVVDTRNSRLLLGGLVLFHLIAISRQVDGGGGASLLERGLFALLSPLQDAAAGLVGGVAGAWRGYVDLRGVGGENEQLKQRVAQLELQLQRREAQAREAERLRDLLQLQQLLPMRSLAAEVVARDGLPWFRSLTVDKGTQAGVRLDTPVICPTGVVGRVVAVGPRAARVQTLLDQASGVGVLIERSRVAGVATGQGLHAEAGSPELPLKYVPVLADVEVGDVAVTSGFDRVFPKGLVVGRVRFAGPAMGLFREVRVAPSARFDALEHVLLLIGEPEAARLTEALGQEPVP